MATNWNRSVDCFKPTKDNENYIGNNFLFTKILVLCDKLQLTLQIQNKEKIVVGGNLNGHLGNDSGV